MPETTVIKLDLDGPGLPCARYKPQNPGGICGRPAYVAIAWPEELRGAWPVFGRWTIQPVCAECAAATMELYR